MSKISNHKAALHAVQNKSKTTLPVDYDSMPLRKLLKISRIFGKHKFKWQWRFLGTLPAIERRQGYLKMGYNSIYEYAARCGGISHEECRRVIHLAEKLEDRPVLRGMLTRGEQSINKLRRIASVATPANEMEMAEKIELLSQAALETYVREKKYEEKMIQFEKQNGLNKPQIEGKPGRAPSQKMVPNIDPRSGELEFSPEFTEKLLNFKAKGFDLEAKLKGLLEEEERQIEEEKRRVTAEIRDKREREREKEGETGIPQTTRHIPEAAKRLVLREHGNQCMAPHCTRRATEWDHIVDFAVNRDHSPDNLQHLCREHHLLKSMGNPGFVGVRKRALEDGGYAPENGRSAVLEDDGRAIKTWGSAKCESVTGR